MAELLSAFSQLLPPGLPQPVVAGAHRLLGFSRLQHLYETFQREPAATDDASMPGRLLRHLRVDCRVAPADLANIPASGPVVFVVNHPFGILEGAALADLLPRIRRDVRFLANALLTGIAELRDLLLPVDVFAQSNVLGVRHSLAHLRAGGALVIFPAGEVAHYQWKQGITDPVWQASVARIARLTNATVAPVYVHGSNSAVFHAAGMVHPRLRTALLIHELFNKQGATVDLRIGSPIAPKQLAKLADDRERTQYLRWRTYLLAHREGSAGLPARSLRVLDQAQEVRNEVAMLPALQQTADFSVYLATAAEIPGVLREIGRLREITFRSIGEGTGQACDLDRFDAHYLHLFLWDRAAGQVAGAYRLGPCDSIMARYGPGGLYTSTLFRYGPGFLRRMQASGLELGRSFIRVEYQKSFAPLLLLWKGIGRFVARNPRYTALFGPVSISNRYREVSRQLMVNFLERQAMDPELARWISTRHRYRPHLSRRAWALTRDGAGWIAGIEELSAAVEDIDRQAVPVLLRQYLSLGGKLLGFNVDPRFSNALDGLILVDLKETDPRLLARLLGKEEARSLRRAG